MEIVHVVKCPKLQRGGTFDLLVTDPECSEAAITAIDMVVGQANFPEGLCVQDPKNPDRILTTYKCHTTMAPASCVRGI